MDLTRCEKAIELHHKGFNCCQSVLAAFGDKTGLEEAAALNIAGGFGAGAGTGELCGALTGAVMTLGLTHAIDPSDPVGGKRRTMGLGKRVQEAFRAAYGDLRCAPLLKTEIGTQHSPAAQAMGLTNRCDIMIVSAIEQVEALLAEEA